MAPEHRLGSTKYLPRLVEVSRAQQCVRCDEEMFERGKPRVFC